MDDLEGLLDPAEGQIDGPVSPVEIGQFLGGRLQVVRGDAQYLAGIGDNAHLARHRVASALAPHRRQKRDVVGKNIALGAERLLAEGFERHVLFKAGDNPAGGSVQLGPPGVATRLFHLGTDPARRSRTLAPHTPAEKRAQPALCRFNRSLVLPIR